jgi:dihydrofolate synthase/folylpolyglutamate synthase
MNTVSSFKSLGEWLPWLETLSPREIVLGLERVEEVLGRLSIDRPPLVISVTGTNGKGSSVTMLEALLRKDGKRTGSYTSPHVCRYNERIRINNLPAGDAEIVAALEQVEKARQGVPLTFFEFGTLAALVTFNAADTDAWILEVGMGGRLDAVNAIEPDGSLITNVSLDHCAWLGNDAESIAREKAGIMRRSKPVIFGSQAVPAAILSIANDLGADLRLAGRDFTFTSNPANRTWNWRGSRVSLNDLQMPALVGDAQLVNAAGVLALLEALQLDHLLDSAFVSEALTSISLPGRFQIVRDRWILDVAHNPAAGQVLAAALRARGLTGRLIAVVGMLADKDVDGFIAALSNLVDTWVSVTVEGSRAETAAELGRKIANASGKPCLVVDDMHAAFRVADERAKEDDVVLVTGSFYVVGPALEWLQKD